MSSPGDEWARAIKALAAIRAARTSVSDVGDDAIARTHDYAGAADLVGVWLEEKMPAPQYVTLLETFLIDPERTAREMRREIVPLVLMIKAELKKAIDAGEPWITPRRTQDAPVGDLLAEYMVEPRAATKWFLASKMRAGLVGPVVERALGDANAPPREETRAISGDGTASQHARPQLRRRGHPGDVSERIMAAMRKMDRERLKAMKQEEMRVGFGAARSTCEKARKAVLGIVE